MINWIIFSIIISILQQSNQWLLLILSSFSSTFLAIMTKWSLKLSSVSFTSKPVLIFTCCKLFFKWKIGSGASLNLSYCAWLHISQKVFKISFTASDITLIYSPVLTAISNGIYTGNQKIIPFMFIFNIFKKMIDKSQKMKYYEHINTLPC